MTSLEHSPTPAATDARPSLGARAQRLQAALRTRASAAARLAWLIEQARARPAWPPSERTDERLLPGCLSRLWLRAEFREGRCRFACDSDSLVVRAVAGVLCDLADGLAPEEILAAPDDLPVCLGLDRLLTASRRAAQARVWEFIRAFSRRHGEPPVES